ncbi:hypothetical protein F3Y22_tig00112399pilonHSYRG00068 [Hibiscus syriacus]|uniref:LRR receptor-like serine/threonine-protein kinase n=1 Tax=Hibiscus syriacus TaxID=106335 RepID=A0A6A2XYK5_HIBSY|nr:hypothetical protein F3Y22_tig00112399pilonHSYRG00068 [Hibiscus syriacus]
MAPEHAMHGQPTKPMSIALVLLLWKSLAERATQTTGRTRTFFYLLDWAHVLRERGSLLDLVDPDLGFEYSSVEAIVMLNVALLCTNASPTLRSIMSQVVSMLEGQTSVQELLSDLGFSSIYSKFKALVNHFWQNPSQTISLSSNGQDTDSITPIVEAEDRRRLLSLRVSDVQSQV